MLELGEMYYLGLGGPDRPQLARRWFRSAAKMGCVEAMVRLAALLSPSVHCNCCSRVATDGEVLAGDF